MITKSISKTNRVVFIDEDVPGGTTAYMMQQVIEKQNVNYSCLLANLFSQNTACY